MERLGEVGLPSPNTGNQLDKAVLQRRRRTPGGGGRAAAPQSCSNQSISGSGASFLLPRLPPRPPCLCWCSRGQHMRGWVGTRPSSCARDLPGLLWLPGPFHWGLWETVAWLNVCGRPWLPPMAGGQRKEAAVDMAALVSDSSWSWPTRCFPSGPVLVPQLGLPCLLPTKYGDPGGAVPPLPPPSLEAWPGLRGGWEALSPGQRCEEGATWRARRPALDPSPGLPSGACDPVVSAPRTGRPALSRPQDRAASPWQSWSALGFLLPPGWKRRVLLSEGGFLLPLLLPGRASAPACIVSTHPLPVHPSIHLSIQWLRCWTHRDPHPGAHLPPGLGPTHAGPAAVSWPPTDPRSPAALSRASESAPQAAAKIPGQWGAEAAGGPSTASPCGSLASPLAWFLAHPFRGHTEVGPGFPAGEVQAAGATQRLPGPPQPAPALEAEGPPPGFLQNKPT